MALVIYGQSVCPICGELVREDQLIFATSGVAFPPQHPLYPFCDAPMHWDCYARWDLRGEFAQGYFRGEVSGKRTNPYWGCAHVDDEIFLTVNPMEPVEEVNILLAATAASVRVKLSDWDRWIEDEALATADLHPLQAGLLLEQLPLLRSKFPTAEAIVDAVNWDEKKELFRKQDAKRKEHERARKESRKQLEPKNLATYLLHARAAGEGLQCPHCRTLSHDYRIVQNRLTGRVEIICRGCGWVFDAEMKAS